MGADQFAIELRSRGWLDRQAVGTELRYLDLQKSGFVTVYYTSKPWTPGGEVVALQRPRISALSGERHANPHASTCALCERKLAAMQFGNVVCDSEADSCSGD